MISLTVVGEIEAERADVRATIAAALDRLAGERMDLPLESGGLVVWLEPADVSHLAVHHAKDCEVPE